MVMSISILNINMILLFDIHVYDNDKFLRRHHFMHQSFVTTAPPPTGKGRNYNFSFQCLVIEPHPRDKLEVKTMLFALPFAIVNLPGLRIFIKTPSFPLKNVIAPHFSPAIPSLPHR